MSNIETLTQHTLTDALAAARNPRDRLLGAVVRTVPRDGAAVRTRRANCGPQYRFAKVNVDEQPAVASAFQIRSIPTLVVISDGEVIGANPGVVGADQLVGALDQLAPTPEPETVLQEGAAR